jgi:hypothetical protein
VFIAPSADCADASPFHCDSGLARMTANEASLAAAIAIALPICWSVMPSSRPAAALCEKASSCSAQEFTAPDTGQSSRRPRVP